MWDTKISEVLLLKMLTDTHSHIYLPEFDSDREAMIENAFENNIHRLFLPNVDSTSIEAMLSASKKYPGKLFPMIGLHPCSVKENFEEELKIVEDYLKEKKQWVAIGEIGIDLYWDKTFVKQQEFVFLKQLDLAVESDLPVVIHSRNSFNEIYDLLVERRNKKPFTSKHLRGIFHCFSGTIEQATKIIEFGNFKLGIGGVVTFKHSGLDIVVGQIDLKHLVLETDSPYLAPVPYRGKRNNPSYLIEVAKKIAEIKNVPVDEVAEITTENSKEVFGI